MIPIPWLYPSSDVCFQESENKEHSEGGDSGVDLFTAMIIDKLIQGRALEVPTLVAEWGKYHNRHNFCSTEKDTKHSSIIVSFSAEQMLSIQT